MSFAIQSINPENYVTVNTLPNVNNNIIWITASTSCVGPGNFDFLDVSTGDLFQFADQDVVLNCAVRGTNMTGAGTSVVTIGSSVFPPGGPSKIFLTNTLTNISGKLDSNPTVSAVLDPVNTGLYFRVNLAVGITAADLVCVCMVWRQLLD